MKKLLVVLPIAGLLLGASPLYAADSADVCANKTPLVDFANNLIPREQKVNVMTSVLKKDADFWNHKVAAYLTSIREMSEKVTDDKKAIIAIMISPTTISQTHPSTALNEAIAKLEHDDGILIEKQAHVINFLYNKVATPEQQKIMAENLISYFDNTSTNLTPLPIVDLKK